MADDDHLDKETSVSLEVSDNGIKASARSRTIAAIDRLGGNLADWMNVRLEESTEIRRAKLDGRLKLIDTAVEYGRTRMSGDQEFAQRILETEFKKIARAQMNKDSVISEALEDLRREPPDDQQAASGPENLAEDFMGRFEFYAESASSDELRQRWGRVLASEIRKPGTFSSKVLRVIDELDVETALLFENVCTHCLDHVLPKCLTGKLAFQDHKRLTTAGLLVEPGLGQIRNFTKVTRKSGEEIWFSIFGKFGIGFLPSIEIRSNDEFKMGDPPSVSVYVLTDAGEAIASILPNQEAATFARLFHALQSHVTKGELVFYTKHPGTTDWLVAPNPQKID